MASATSKPEKKLAEFLKEQQEPFILELYLLERSPCSKKCSSTISLEKPATSCFNKNRKPLFSFFKVLTSIHKKKLGFHTAIKDSNTTNTNKHANVGVTVTREIQNVVDQTDVVETERFSTASSSTMFNSCSDIDDEEENRTSFSSYKHNNPLFSSDTCQASSVSNLRIQSQLHNTNNRKHRKRCIEVCVTHETLNKDVCVCGLLVPKKITEDSVLSAALWSSLIHTTKKDQNCAKKELKEIFGYDVSHVMKSKRVLHKTKRMLFDYVRELTASVLRKDCKQFMGPEKLGKIIWEKSQRSGNGTNIINLLNLDYLDSINEWSEFKTQVKDVGVEIADAIFECVMNDVIVL